MHKTVESKDVMAEALKWSRPPYSDHIPEVVALLLEECYYVMRAQVVLLAKRTRGGKYPC